MGKSNGTDYFEETVPVFSVVSNGVDPVTLRLSVNVLGPGGTGNWMGINGLEISNIPEPSSAALLGVGSLFFLRRRR